MTITAAMVKELREKTGAGFMDSKKALEQCEGDMEKAMALLRERGIAKAEKKASRIAAEGIVACYTEGKVGVLVELNCESDFVAKNPQFSEIANEVSKVLGIPVKMTCCDEKLYEKLKDKVENLFPLSLQKLYYHLNF